VKWLVAIVFTLTVFNIALPSPAQRLMRIGSSGPGAPVTPTHYLLLQGGGHLSLQGGGAVLCQSC
jgi:hypothetical protein